MSTKNQWEGRVLTPRKTLLVCIAFHYAEERLKYLEQVISEFVVRYECPVYIIVDTNSHETKNKIDHPEGIVQFVVHDKLEHPFHLTCMHRSHIAMHANEFDVFMYVEDDMLVPYENYVHYLENFSLLWPNYVPSFIRIEQKDGVDFVSDVPQRQALDVVGINGREFAAIPFPYNYHAFWIMPRDALIESIRAGFSKLFDGREFNAMFVGWGLSKKALVELEGGRVSKKCYSYHLPNNYALSPDSPNGKLEADNIFIS